MRHVGTLLALSLWTSFAVAKVPAVLKVTDRSVQIASSRLKVSKAPVDYNKKMNELMADMNDPKISAKEILIRYVEASSNNQKDAEDLNRQIENSIENFNARYAIELRQYIEALAQKQNAKKHREGGVVIYALEDGLRFYEEFYQFAGKTDPWFRATAEAFLSSGFRNLKVADKTEKLAVAVREGLEAQTRLFDASHFTEEDLLSLKNIAAGKNKRLQFEKIGSTWVFGSGLSYWVTRDLLHKGNTLSDPVLKARWDRILRYHTNSGLPLIHRYIHGPVANFNLLEGHINFILPGQIGLGAYAHEMTHSRFEKFTKTLDRWAASKNYLVPFHIEGPYKGGSMIGHGGLFNLLNEVNSWRLGESFGDSLSDGEILKVLRRSYGAQAGHEATELFEKIWTPAGLKGKSIPYLIYDEIRSFNKSSNEDLLNLGQEGLEEKDLVKKMNFLIMHKAGRFKGTSLEAEADDVLAEIARVSDEPEVRRRLGFRESVPKKDLTGLSFEDVYSEFAQNGSGDAKNVILEKYLKELSPAQIQDLAERIRRSSTNSFHFQGLEVLKALFRYLKINPPLEPGTDGRGGPRPRLVGHPFLEALDRSLSQALSQESLQLEPGSKMTGLIHFSALHALPEEMPQTYAKTLDLLLHPQSRPPEQVHAALSFLYLPEGAEAGKALLWGEKLAQDLKGVRLSSKVKEAFSVFYMTAVPSALSLEKDLGISKRNKDLKDRRLSEEQKIRLESASQHLWSLAADEDPGVRQSALYAMVSYSAFLVKNQGRLLQALYQKDLRYAQAVRFLMEVHPELMPEARRIWEIQIRKQKDLALKSAPVSSEDVKLCSRIFK